MSTFANGPSPVKAAPFIPESYARSEQITWCGITIHVIGWLETTKAEIVYRWRRNVSGVSDGASFAEAFPNCEPTLLVAERLVAAKAATQPLRGHLTVAASAIERACWGEHYGELAHDDDAVVGGIL